MVLYILTFSNVGFSGLNPTEIYRIYVIIVNIQTSKEVAGSNPLETSVRLLFS